MNKVFVMGLSGSGKDTVSNFLRDQHSFVKLRLAKTVKQIICEKNNLTADELEKQKRLNPELRDLHHLVSAWLDENKPTEAEPGWWSRNRIQQLIDGTSIEFEMLDNLKNRKQIICDVRSVDEAEMLLQNDWVGIYLTRTTSEYRNSEHFTEKLRKDSLGIERLMDDYNDYFYTITNDDCDQALDPEIFETLFRKGTEFDYKTCGTDDALILVIKDILGLK